MQTPTGTLTAIVRKIDAALSVNERSDPNYLRHVLRGLRATAAESLALEDLDAELVDLAAPPAAAK